MKSNDVRDQLEALRKEVRTLSASIIDLQGEDTRKVFGEQVKSVLTEKIDRFFSQKERMRHLSPETHDQCKIELNDLVLKAIVSFQTYGPERASKILDEHAAPICQGEITGPMAEYSRFYLDIIRQMRSYFESSEDALNPRLYDVGVSDIPSYVSAKRSLSPTSVEDMLAPLANAWRIDILMRLSNDDETLTGLSNGLGLKKGHLQFHIDSLLSAKYIKYDRKSHLYSITARGAITLDEIKKLIERLHDA